MPIWARPPRLNPKEEAWLDVYLDELVAKGIISPIFQGSSHGVILLLLIPGVQSGQPYWVCQNTVLVNKWTAKYQCQLNDMRQYWA